LTPEEILGGVAAEELGGIGQGRGHTFQTDFSQRRAAHRSRGGQAPPKCFVRYHGGISIKADRCTSTKGLSDRKVSAKAAFLLALHAVEDD